MSKNSNNKSQEKQDNKEDPPIKYIFTLSVNIILAMVLAVLINKFVNLTGDKFGFNIYTKILVQILFVGVVIFIVKELSKYIHHEPEDNYSYDVMFISVFMSSQQNFQELLKGFK